MLPTSYKAAAIAASTLTSSTIFTVYKLAALTSFSAKDPDWFGHFLTGHKRIWLGVLKKNLQDFRLEILLLKQYGLGFFLSFCYFFATASFD